MLQISWPTNQNLSQDSEVDFEAGNTRICTLQAGVLPACQYNVLKASANANGIDMFCLPQLWSMGSKMEELRRLSTSDPAIVAGPLKSLIEYVLHDLSTLSVIDHFSPSDSNRMIKEWAVFQNCRSSAQFTADLTDDQDSDILRQSPDRHSAIDDVGIPKLCTDIVYLLIDDLLHISEKKAHRCYRVWSSSGSAMLVSSTTIKFFNAAGYLVEVRSHPHTSNFRHKACRDESNDMASSNPCDGMACAGPVPPPSHQRARVRRRRSSSPVLLPPLRHGRPTQRARAPRASRRGRDAAALAPPPTVPCRPRRTDRLCVDPAPAATAARFPREATQLEPPLAAEGPVCGAARAACLRSLPPGRSVQRPTFPATATRTTCRAGSAVQR
jgi:hypothetical protein